MFFHLRRINSKYTLMPWGLDSLPSEIIASSTDEINTYEAHYGIKDGNLYLNGILVNKAGDIIKLYLRPAGILVETSQTKEEYQVMMESFFRNKVEDNIEDFVPTWNPPSIPVKLGDTEIGYAVEKSGGVYNVHITADNVIPEDKENISFSIRSESSETRKRTIEDIYREAVGRRSLPLFDGIEVSLRKPTFEELVKFNDGLEAQFGRGRETAKGGKNRKITGPNLVPTNLCYEDWVAQQKELYPEDWDEWNGNQLNPVINRVKELLDKNQPTPVGETTANGEKILDRQTTVDADGNLVSSTVTYEQFGMVHIDCISSPGIDVPKIKKDENND